MSKVIYIGKLASVPSGISSFFTQIKIEFTVYVDLKFVGICIKAPAAQTYY